jgi:meiotically up-regulated gene 157 (Mug157) protein
VSDALQTFRQETDRVTRTIYQLFIPANMMFSRYLDSASKIMAAIGGQRNLANHMHNFAQSIRAAITTHGIVSDDTYGQIYAFEVDGFGSRTFSRSISALYMLILGR